MKALITAIFTLLLLSGCMSTESQKSVGLSLAVAMAPEAAVKYCSSVDEEYRKGIRMVVNSVEGVTVTADCKRVLDAYGHLIVF